MPSFDGLQARAMLATGVSQFAIADTPVAIRIRKVGAETATSVTVTTATNIVLVGSTTTDTLAFATYTTVGLLADAINATGRWEAKVLDALRSDLTASSYFVENTAVTAGVDANGVTIWEVHPDTSVYKAVTTTLKVDRDFDVLPRGHRVHLQEIKYFATLGGAGTNLVRVYRRRGSTETQIFGATSVSATATTINWASGYGKISGKEAMGPGNGITDELVVRLQDATSISDTALNLTAIGIIE